MAKTSENPSPSDTTHLVRIRLIVVVRVATTEIDVPSIRRAVLSRRPIVGRPEICIPALASLQNRGLVAI